jgi:hypothetical protein
VALFLLWKTALSLPEHDVSSYPNATPCIFMILWIYQTVWEFATLPIYSGAIRNGSLTFENQKQAMKKSEQFSAAKQTSEYWLFNGQLLGWI